MKRIGNYMRRGYWLVSGGAVPLPPAPPSGYTPALKFDDARNSMYLGSVA